MIKFENLPKELRDRPQWCVVCPKFDESGVVIPDSKAPLSLDASGTKLYNASPIAPNQWMSFAQASWMCVQDPTLLLGYILHVDDPFACIDLDVKDCVNAPNLPEKWTTPEQFDLFYRIMQTYDSYTELSHSGKGLHIWVKGKIGAGVHREGVEVYSQERFIICTGNPINNVAIAARQDMLDNMVSQMRVAGGSSGYKLVELDAEDDDWVVLDKCVSAANGDKFTELFMGRYQQFGFPSQSEADLALMSIFTFYSKSNAQCRRLFRSSHLGVREKAQKDDRYVNFTLGLIRARQSREENVDISGIEKAAMVQLMVKSELDRLQGVNAAKPSMLHVPGPDGTSDPIQLPPDSGAAFAMSAPTAEVTVLNDNGIAWPPGLAGQIAQFIYQNAPRPIKEVAIVATLGMLAGICGKAWCIPQSGLNMYVVLVARSGVGKEALHSGISSIIASISSREPFASKFFSFNDFASGPALTKGAAEIPCFVNITSEFGRKLKRLAADDGRDGPMSSLRTVMTALYQKSGPKNMVGGIAYSDKDSNVAGISGVAYSMIGETTPGTFFASLTQSMMEDGFLSRFTVIEYTGERPPLNPAPLMEPSKALADAIAELCRSSNQLIAHNKFIDVGRTEEAARMLQDFEIECDNEINGSEDESYRQMWNRAALKVMRISALLAVSDNSKFPVIQRIHVEWALDVIRRDIAMMNTHISIGDIGSDDSARDKRILSILKKYLQTGSNDVPPKMAKDGIIPRKFIQMRISNYSCFTGSRFGAVKALDDSLRNMMENGIIQEIDKSSLVTTYGFHGKCYRILGLS